MTRGQRPQRLPVDPLVVAIPVERQPKPIKAHYYSDNHQ